jgi:branched-chain amino acid aminotransferase
MFGSGTAALVSPVKSFHYDGDTYDVPIEEEAGAGELAQHVLKTLNDLQYGVVKRPEWQFDI